MSRRPCRLLPPDARVDRALGFIDERDRVQLDPGVDYTVSQRVSTCFGSAVCYVDASGWLANGQPGVMIARSLKAQAPDGLRILPTTSSELT